MIEFLKRFRLFFTAVLFLLVAFLILAIHSGRERETPMVEKALLQVSSPLQKNAHKVISWFQGVGEHYLLLTRVQQENQDLKRWVSALREENNRLKETILANERLKNIYSLQSRYSSTSIVAQVFARDASNWFNTILVDRGQRDGISKDMAVVTADGIVGRVIEVSSHTAKVLLITDPNSALDVIVQRSRSQGIIEGKVEEICILKYVQKSDDVQVGDKVITSGLGGIFPKGLMTGTVCKVDPKYPGIFQYIEVTPAVDLSRLEEVLILKEEP